METNQQQFCTEMMKRLNIQRKNGEFCDVILEVGGEQGEMDVIKIKAHKNVLSSASLFFYSALKSDMKENKEGIIRLVEKRKSVVELVIEYLYTGLVEITQENAYDFLELSDYLMLSGLKILSETFLRQHLDVSNCISAFYYARKYQCQQLEDEANYYILANFASVAQSEDFLDLSFKQVEDWISKDTLIINCEEDVFRIILKWVQKDEGSRSEHFSDLFRHVRCVFVSRDYLLSVIALNRLVQNNNKCMKLVFDALRWIAGGTDQCFVEQAPRYCLKTHEEAIIACGGDKSTWCYLPTEESWYLLKSGNSTRTAHATTFCDGKLYVVGGSVDGGNVAERYDPSLNSWTTIQGPSQVTRHIAVATFQGCVYAIGGKDDAENKSSFVQKYNPETNQWQKVSPLSSPRSSVCAVASDDHLYAVGGLSNNRAALDTAERFSLKTNSWKMIAPLPEGRNGASGVSFNEKLFLFGGVRRTRAFEIYDSNKPVEFYRIPGCTKTFWKCYSF